MAEWERELLAGEQATPAAEATEATDVETGPTPVQEAADATAAADVVDPAEQAGEQVAEATAQAAAEATETGPRCAGVDEVPSSPMGSELMPPEADRSPRRRQRRADRPRAARLTASNR